MAQNSKVTKWAKDNQEALYMLYEDGVLSEEQLRTLVNLNGNYDVTNQDSEFDRVKEIIQSKLTNERIDEAVKNNSMSADDAKMYKSLFKSVDKFDKPKDALLSSKLTEQIKNSGYQELPLLKGMTDQIKNMSDKDVREYIYNQRQFLNQMLPGKAIESIPDLQEYMTVQPTYGVKNTNYAKIFNDDEILDKLNEIPFRDIDYIARKNGMTGKELLKDMSEAKIAKDREDIAHGRWRSDASIPENLANEVGGTLLTLFGRRQQESIARGEEPKLKDIAGDIGEQLAYMAPVGRIAGPVSRVASRIPEIGQVASKVAAAATNVGSNAIVPTATELYDKIVYDDDNPRGEFSIADALVGTGVNAAAPWALREAGEGLGKLTGSSSIQKTWGELAKGKTSDEIVKEIQNKYKGVNIQDADNPNVSAEVRRRAQELKSIIAADPDLENTVTSKRPLVFDVAKEPGKTLAEKARNYVNRIYPSGYTMLDVDASAHAPTVSELYNMISKTEGAIQGNPELTVAGKMGKFLPEKLAQYESNPNVISDRLMNVYDKLGLDAVESAKSSRELLEEDLIKNYLTNQAGNFIYSDRNITIPGLSLLPFDINQLLKEQREKDEREKAKEESRRRLPTLESIYGNLK